MEYFADLEKKIDALTPQQITVALKNHVKPAELVIVLGPVISNSLPKSSHELYATLATSVNQLSGCDLALNPSCLGGI